jgi:osmotically-inducible protein OsmY
MLAATDIGVTAKEGLVVLSGLVHSYFEKMQAEHVAKNVRGVKALVEQIQIVFPSSWTKTDTEVAREALSAIKFNPSIPTDYITLLVENGWVTLEGEVEWNYQKEAAKKSIDYLMGVKGITNNIHVKSDLLEDLDKKHVEEALTRSSSIDARDIMVAVSDTTVTLTGTVDSWYQREEAGRLAWNTPGIWCVKNDIAVDNEYNIS